MSHRGSGIHRPRQTGDTKSKDTELMQTVASSRFPANGRDGTKNSHSNSHSGRHEGRRDSNLDVQRMSRHMQALTMSADMESKVGSVVARTDKGDTHTNWRHYTIGDIILVPYVTPNLDPNLKLGDRQAGLIEDTGPVIGKMRPSIILSIYGHSMLCLPVFTSQGKGIHKSVEEECLRLRTWGDDSRGWDSLHPSEYLMVEPGHYVHESCYIRLTHPFVVDYEYPMKYLYRLTEKSSQRLHQMWLMTMAKGGVYVKDQPEYARHECRKIKVCVEYEKARKVESPPLVDKDGFTTVSSAKRRK